MSVRLLWMSALTLALAFGFAIALRSVTAAPAPVSPPGLLGPTGVVDSRPPGLVGPVSR